MQSLVPKVYGVGGAEGGADTGSNWLGSGGSWSDVIGGSGGWSFNPWPSDPFLPVPTGGTTITVPGWLGNDIPSPIPGVGMGGTLGTGQGSTSVGGALSTITGVAAFLANPLRWVLLIIGLMMIAGAIYLFKPTSEIVAAPARAARDAAVAIAA